MITRLLSVCFVGSFLLPLSAQTPEIVTVEFTAVGWECELPEVAYQTAGKPETFRVPLFSRSAAQIYTGPAHLVFRDASSAAVQPEERPTLGTVDISPDTRRLLLLFVPLDDGTHRIIPLPEQPETFPAGHARVFNATNRSLAIKTRDGSPIMLTAGSHALFAGDGRSLGLRIAREQGGRWRVVAGNILALHPDERLTLFLTTSESSHFKPVTNGDTRPDIGPISIVTLRD